MSRFAKTPEDYASEPIEGFYKTPARNKPFYLKEEAGDIHIFTGYKYKQGDFSEDGDVILFDKEKVIAKTIAFIREQGEVALGSTAHSRLPDKTSLEAFLRSFSVHERLASYIPSVLEKIGAIELFRKDGSLYARPADALPENSE